MSSLSELPSASARSTDNLVSYLLESIEEYADSNAVDFYSKKRSYAELDEASDKVAKGLQNQGLQKGDRVAVYMPNCLDYPEIFLGILKAGGVFVGLNSLKKTEQIADEIKTSGAKILMSVDNEKFLPTAARLAADKDCALEHVNVFAMKDMINTSKIIKEVVKMIKARFNKSAKGQTPEEITEEKLIARMENAKEKAVTKALLGSEYVQSKITSGREFKKNDGQYSAVSLSSSDPAILIFTGGTTGKPKAAMHTHGSMVAGVEQCIEGGFTPYGLEEGQERMLAALPFFHIFGLQAVLLMGLRTGSELLMVPNPKDKQDMLEIAAAGKASLLPVVPKMFLDLEKMGQTAKNAFTFAKAILFGGEALRPDLVASMKAIAPDVPVSQGYGATESGILAVQLPGTDITAGVGSLFKDVEVRFVDSMTGAEVAPGEEGEIHIRGPQVMAEYWQNPEKTDEVMDADGWYNTGDLGKMVGETLKLTGRSARQAKINGEKVQCEDVEAVLSQHKALAESVVIRLQEPRGEALKAVVRVQDDQTISEKELRDFMQEGGLHKLQIPKYVEFTNEPLPLTEMSKVNWKLMEQQEAQKSASSPAPATPNPQPN